MRKCGMRLGYRFLVLILFSAVVCNGLNKRDVSVHLFLYDLYTGHTEIVRRTSNVLLLYPVVRLDNLMKLQEYVPRNSLSIDPFLGKQRIRIGKRREKSLVFSLLR
jgi:hypothetical protein